MKFLLLCFLGGGSQLWIFTKIKFSREIYAFFCSQKNERFFIHQQTTLKSVKFMIFSSQKKKFIISIWIRIIKRVKKRGYQIQKNVWILTSRMNNLGPLAKHFRFFSELFPIFQIFVENSKLFWDYYYCSFF